MPAQPRYSTGSVCAQSVCEVNEIQSWQRNKSLILTCGMKMIHIGGVRWTHTEAMKDTLAEKGGERIWTGKDIHNMKRETETQRHVSELYD